MKTALFLLFCGIFLAMTIVTVNATLTRSVFENAHLMQDVWFQATLCDAYFGFLTFGVWVVYRESSSIKRTLWVVAIMLLGNFAMSSYVLWNLWKLPTDAPLDSLLLKPEKTT